MGEIVWDRSGGSFLVNVTTAAGGGLWTHYFTVRSRWSANEVYRTSIREGHQ